MKLNRLFLSGVALSLSLALVLPGCGLCDDDTNKKEPVAQKPVEQKAPKAEPKAAEPMRQEAPRTGMVTESMAFPTGDRATSVLWVERRMPAEVVLGQPFEYEICVTNISKLTVKDVVITDDCTNFNVTGSTPNATRSAANGLQWNLGNLAPGEKKCITVKGTATASGKVTTCAAVTFSSALCLETNVVQPAIKIVHTATPEVVVCDPIQVTGTVTNTGSGMARNVKVKVNVPAGLKCSGPTDVDVGTLGAGESRNFSLTCQADKSGSFQTQAAAMAEGGLNASSEAKTTVAKQAVLTIAKNCPGRQFLGRNTTFEIVVKNTGDGVAKDCVVEDMLPANATFVSASNGGQASGGKVMWNLGNLAPNDTKTVTVVVTASVAGKVANTASARAYCANAVTANCATDYQGIPALLLEVADEPDPVQIGTETTYTIEVTNQGSATAHNVKIACMLPGEESFVSAGGQTAGTNAGGTVTFAPLATLAPKAKAVWTVKIKAMKEGDVRFKTTMIADELKSNVEETESTNLYQ